MKQFILLLLCCLAAGAQEAPTLVIPPEKEAEPEAFPQAVLREYLTTQYPLRSFDTLQGRNNELQKEADNSGGALEVAEGYEVAVDAHTLFASPIIEGSLRTWLAGVQSLDAYALRVQVDLSGLAEDEELWVIDPGLPRAFGPYQAADQKGNAFWTPTIEGDTAILMLRSKQDTLPPLRIERLSHFFRESAPDEVKCPINVRCEVDPEILEASTAVGRVHMTRVSGGTVLCSGSLINAPHTAEAEELFITANHCFLNAVEMDGLEVIWDYKRSGCTGTDPALGSLPRSLGAEMLTASGSLDFALLQLTSVPNGPEGRAFLGWSLTKAVQEDQVIGMHHPAGQSMKICYGHVTRIDRTSIYGRLQNEFQWDEGITEGGSSGSPSLYADSLLLMGVLSNGAVHVCGDPERNVDNYSSFREFFPEIACYLTDSEECDEGTSTCPAKEAFGENSVTVAALRDFRDEVLANKTWGQALIREYYQRAPQMAAAVNQSQDARALFGMIALPVALYQRWQE